MKKILLVGKLNKTLGELYDCLSRRFQVQVSAEQEKIVEGMLQIVKVDMILINIMELEDIEENIFQVIEKLCPELPVVLIGTEEAFHKYQQYCQREQITQLKRPISKQLLMQHCYQLAKVDGTSGTESPETEDDENKKHILIVDDSAITLRGIKAMLDKEYQITVATSGEQALKTLRKKKPDLVLLDYEMPGWDGRETLERIRAEEDIADIPVIFLTGVADKEHIAAVLKLNPA